MSLPIANLGSTGIRTTSLGFGCATLFRAANPAERLRLLNVAHESGIRHFDVAPMYGLGRAESELGSFIRSRRSDVTVATKFGIRPTMACRCFARVQRPVRRLLRSKPAIGDQVRAHAAAPSHLLFEQGGYDAVSAGRSLRQSLRRLRTDHVDLLLLHDPIPGSVRSAEIYAFLEDARTAGMIRSWGITGAPEIAADVALGFRHVPLLQVRSDVLTPPLPGVPGSPALITFGVIGDALGRIVQHVRTSAGARDRWHAATGADCGDPEAVSSFLLRAAFQANTSGVVLFGASRPAHIGAAAMVAEKNNHVAAAGDAQIDSFISLARMELLMPGLAAGEAS